jgi:hypothetical protein
VEDEEEEEAGQDAGSQCSEYVYKSGDNYNLSIEAKRQAEVNKLVMFFSFVLLALSEQWIDGQSPMKSVVVRLNKSK